MMATDYDAPRRSTLDPGEMADDAVEVVHDRRHHAQSAEVDEIDTAESVELPGADLSGEERRMRVVPQQADEFRCSACFLVQHRHRYAGQRHGQPICQDCVS